MSACDTHIHFYDHNYRVAPSATLTPPDASVEEYRDVQMELGLERVVVVQPTTYGLDNSCQLEAIAQLGSSARGVVAIDSNVTDAELGDYSAKGVRGARFHMLPGGAVSWDHLEPVAQRIAAFGWHIQLQLNGHELAHRREQLLGLACPLVIDHVGRFMPPVAPDSTEFKVLLDLVDAGAHVKLSAPYESAPDPQHDYALVTECAQALVGHAPERVLWASNWPHPGQSDPPTNTDLARLAELWFPDSSTREQAMITNPARLYGF